MVSEYDTMHICLSNQLKWAKVGFSYCSTVLRIHQRCLFRQNSQCINCTDKYNEKHYRKSDLHVNQSVSLVICSNRKYFERETERDRERERERERERAFQIHCEVHNIIGGPCVRDSRVIV